VTLQPHGEQFDFSVLWHWKAEQFDLRGANSSI